MDLCTQWGKDMIQKNGANSIGYIYIIMCNTDTDEKLLYNKGSSASSLVLCHDLDGSDGGQGRVVQEEAYVYNYG